MKALILNDKVIEVKEKDFPVAEPLKWVDCPDDCEPGWNYDPISGTVSEPIVPVPGDEELLIRLSDCMTNHIRQKAFEKHYDSPETVVTYIHSSDPLFKDEATKFVAFRDASWIYYLDIDGKVRAGEIKCPSENDFISGAPKIDW